MAGKSTTLQQSSTISKDKKPSKEISIISRIYLIIYNFAQVIGWSYMFYQLIEYYTILKLTGDNTKKSLWDHIKWTVVIFQNAALLEILHAAIRIVSSNVIVTTFQVFSRVFVVCGVLLATPIGYSPGVPLAILAWSITEIIRYGYYGFNLINFVPYPLVWLRYTTFYVLYPVGVTGELLCIYWAAAYVKENPIWTVALPNKGNFTFSYYYFLWIVMIMYFPLFPKMYLHMIGQRKKIIGGGIASTSGHKKSK